MLYIKTRENRGFEQEWHVGEPVPLIRTQVVTFQADGDELSLILRAMNESKGRDE